MKPRLVILPHVYAEIMHYVRSYDKEISGLGRVERASDGTMVVTKVYLPTQENDAASTDLDEASVAKLLYTSREDKGSMSFWWHSHVNMSAFWSGTDHATIQQFGEGGFVVATVFNKRAEYKTALYRKGDEVAPSLFIDDIETSFEYMPTQAQRDEWDANIKASCRAKTYASSISPASYWGSTQDYQGLGWPEEETTTKPVSSSNYRALSGVPIKSLVEEMDLAVSIAEQQMLRTPNIEEEELWAVLSLKHRDVIRDCMFFIYGFSYPDDTWCKSELHEMARDGSATLANSSILKDQLDAWKKVQRESSTKNRRKK
jgi:proteasome lid subunit RPN8/RPN11